MVPLSDKNFTSAPPKLSLLTMLRLGLFQMGLGANALLAGGVLNRLAIEGLGIPATVVGLLLGVQYFVAPTRVWFGQLSDTRPLWGLHRTGYVRLGAALFTFTLFLALQLTWRLGEAVQTHGGWDFTPEMLLWTGTLAIAFAVYGIGISFSSTPFAALLVDVSDEEERPQLVGVAWSLLTVGIVVGAIISGIFLKPLQAGSPVAELRGPMNTLFAVMPALIFALAWGATWNIERRYSRLPWRRTPGGDREDRITLGRALRILTANRQTGIFFGFLIALTIALFLQEPVLEPYGGEVFGMSYSQTTRLNAYWGMGVLMGYVAAGFYLIRRLGKQTTTAAGCVAVGLSFVLMGLAGFGANVPLLLGVLVAFGVASGVATAGAINLMLDLTAAETAGTFIGAWGLAQALSRGTATTLGGALLDLGKRLLSTPTLSYALVFGVQALVALAAFLLLQRVSVEEFQRDAQASLVAVLETDLE